ncbi:hypothetical protein HDU67_010212, partial [Dinochytrium kinnereticum]
MALLRSYLLKKAFSRPRLNAYNTLDHAVQLFEKSHRIVVLTGAGLSVSCGIPDFRSENGLYAQLADFNLDDPQQIFDIEYFKECPEKFYSFAATLIPGDTVPSFSHNFIAHLEKKGKLLRNYTQNIDGIERKAGIQRVVFCHGSFDTSSCSLCGRKFEGNLQSFFVKKKVKYCDACKKGPVKPDIVFFGEELPKTFDNLFAEDIHDIDLLVVIGSSLKVAPISTIIINLDILANMEAFDLQLQGECDTGTEPAFHERPKEELGDDLDH